MGWTCGRNARELHAGFGWGNMKERNDFESLGVGGRITLAWILEKYDEQEWA
jgi:hypothetical protein